MKRDIPGNKIDIAQRGTSGIEDAAVWYSANRDSIIGTQIISTLRKRFGLTPLEAIKALRKAGCN